MNMFQMIVIFTLESKIGLLNLGFGTYYDHCVGQHWSKMDFGNLRKGLKEGCVRKKM